MISQRHFWSSMPYQVGVAALVVAVLSFSGCGTPGKKLPVTSESARMGANNVQEITVEAASFYFKPSRITVAANVPVRLTLTSHTFIIGHNFSLHAPEAGVDVDKDIGHGKTAVIEFTPTKAGEYSFFCDKDGHAGKGMKGTLVVTP